MSERHWGPGFIEACFGGKPTPENLTARLRAKPCPAISPPAIELEAADRIEQLEEQLKSAWREAAKAWSVCASIHQTFGKGRDAVFKTRQSDFTRHHETASRKAKGE